MKGKKISKFVNRLYNMATSLPPSSITITRISPKRWCITYGFCNPNAVSRPSIRFWLAPKFNPAGEEVGKNGSHLDGKESCRDVARNVSTIPKPGVDHRGRRLVFFIVFFFFIASKTSANRIGDLLSRVLLLKFCFIHPFGENLVWQLALFQNIYSKIS